LNSINSPVFFELSLIGLCLLVSLIVLIVDLVLWVRELRECCKAEETQKWSIFPNNETQQNEDISSNTPVDKPQELTLDQLEIMKEYS
jgi:hypothetical protein